MQLTANEFNAMMQSVDRALIDEGIRVSARPIQATLRILQQHSCSGPIAHPDEQSLDYPVTNFNLANHASSWYELRYGDRLKIDWSPGRFPMFIEADIYVCRLPLGIGGQFLILASKNRFSHPQILNAIDFIDGLPEFVRSRLEDSVENIANAMFATAMEVTKEMFHSKATLQSAAKTDIDLSCDCLASRTVDASQSAWHSLQFAEKVLKDFISRTRRYDRHHRIDRLRDDAVKCGYVPDSRIRWDLFAFDAGVRYDPSFVNRSHAVDINHEAWRVGYNVLKQLPVEPPSKQTAPYS